jgi:hypothetical protein
MPSEAKIKARYKALHDKLGVRYYEKHELTKEEFDAQHGKIWNDMEAELITEGYRQPPEPLRDPLAEIDDIKVKLKEKGIL